MKVKRYIIYQKSTYWTSGGYWTGKTYVHQGDKFGVFESDITLAKKYKSKKNAENVIKKIHWLANGYNEACFIVSIEVEEDE